eukprot:9651994-Alexandrium_andersonii.AAC.1
MWRWALGGERGLATERAARFWLTAAESRLLPTRGLRSRLGRLPVVAGSAPALPAPRLPGGALSPHMKALMALPRLRRLRPRGGRS